MTDTDLRFRIDLARCTGCCECLKVCRDHAIRKVTSNLCAKCPKYCAVYDNDVLGCDQNKMCIDPNACTGCGKCLEVCPHGAIVPLEADACPSDQERQGARVHAWGTR